MIICFFNNEIFTSFRRLANITNQTVTEILNMRQDIEEQFATFANFCIPASNSGDGHGTVSVTIGNITLSNNVSCHCTVLNYFHFVTTAVVFSRIILETFCT